jgi:hypothetical protein
MEFRSVWALVAALLLPMQASAWGPEGHSTIAELAQHRLSPRAAAEVERLLGPGRSLASVGSWGGRRARRSTGDLQLALCGPRPG